VNNRLSDTYLWPLLLTILLFVVSALTGAVEIKRLATSALLLGILLGGILLVQFAAARSTAHRASDGLFHVVASVAMSDSRAQVRTGVLTEAEVIALEASARRVWIYAYDLAWEGNSSPFTEVVRSNLDRGVKYRYLIPDAADVKLRAQQIKRELKVSGRRHGLVAFKTTQRERLITQFGLTIYNPTLLEDDSNKLESVAVFFPHLHFSDGESPAAVPFLAVRGSAVLRLQEAFMEYWESGAALSRRS